MFTENKYTKHSMIKNVLVFLFVALFAFVICFNGMVCHAEDLTTISDVFGTCNGFFDMDGWESSSSYQSGYIVNFSDTSINSALLENLNNLEIPSDIPDISNKKIYVFYEGGNNFIIKFLDKKYNVQDYNRGILALGFTSELTDSTIYQVAYSYNQNIQKYESVVTSYTPYQDNSAVPPISYYNLGDGGYLCCASDTIYACDNYTANLPNAMSYFAYYIVDYSNQPYHYINSNYIAIDMGQDGGFGGSGGSGGSMSEDIEKGLYLLKGSCVYLENKSFNDGTLHVNALFSDIQKNNPNLQVAVKGTCTYSFEQTAQSSLNTRIYVGDYSNTGDSSLFGILWPGESYSSSHTKTVNCTYGLLGASYISIDSFSGGIYTKPLTQVNSSMFTNDIGGYTMASFGGANIRPIASAYDSVNSNKFIIRNMSIDTGTPISFNTGFLDESSQKTDVYLTDVKYNFELYVIDTSDSNNIEWSDVIYSYSFDMLNGTSSVGTDGTLTYDDLDNNFDGDIPSEYLPSTDVNSSGGSASSSSGGNNQVVTINGDDSAKYLPSLINKLVPSTEGDGGLSEDFQNLTNSNGWIQYMSATLYFVPASVWTTLNTYFITYIAIIGVAFIIRIILDLL